VPNEKGVYTRIDPYRIDKFHEFTSQYIIRREKHEVLRNLPALTRDYQYMEIEDEEIKKIYNSELDLFSNFLNGADKIQQTQLLGWLAKLRAITGQAKVPWAIEYTEQFLDETEDSLALGIHHRSVRDTLFYAFTNRKFNPLKLSGEDDMWQKDRVQEAFNEGRNRLLIINAIAGGVGLNLQKRCANAVVLERMWNSADEEQFEARFHRDGQQKPVQVVYPIASGTIDEWFHDMVCEKRRIVGNTMGDSGFNLEDDEASLMELAEKTIANKLR
jgi:SNF2 family DNA or RNA helicase